MRILRGSEKEEALDYLLFTNRAAWGSSCYRAKCGSIIVKDKKIIGVGFNSPPKNKRLTHCFKDDLPADFSSDGTCCVHAEQRAIMDALARNSKEIFDSRIYFTRQDENHKIKMAGKPYCTICSKMALDAGISEWVLWHDKGIVLYGAEEYNKISFGFKKWSP